jgi:hypothetical protein
MLTQESRIDSSQRVADCSIAQFGFEIVNCPVERNQFGVIDFGDVDAEAMMDRGDEIEKVHGIYIKRLSQICACIDRFQVDFGSDVSEFFAQDHVNVNIAHSLSGSCNSLPIPARNSAPAWPSLTL